MKHSTLLVVAGLLSTTLSQSVHAQQHAIEYSLAPVFDLSLLHVREFIDQGKIQFEPVNASASVVDALEQWVQANNHGLGAGEEAVSCIPGGGCKGVASFRGIVEIEILQHSAAAAEIRLSMFRLPVRHTAVQMRIDELHLRVNGSRWTVDRVVRIAES